MKWLSVANIARLSAVLAILFLGTPLVWMKIGPGGYKFYGPDVPDIYILGGFILGKDISFWGISFAIVFQLIFILIFIVNCFRVASQTISDINKRVIVTLNSILLILFPVWLYEYIGGVKSNSDGADLTVHFHAGIALYALLVMLDVLLAVKVRMKLEQLITLGVIGFLFYFIM